MTCLECGGSYKDKFGHLELTDKYIGAFEVENIQYLKCTQCNDLLFPTATAEKITKKKKEILDQLVKAHPIDAFMSASETADFLEISRQALHKHRRIKRGFIFQTRLGEKTWYLRDSVQLYRKKEDGRYPLVERSISTEYITMTDSVQVVPLEYPDIFRIEQESSDIYWHPDISNKINKARDSYVQ